MTQTAIFLKEGEGKVHDILGMRHIYKALTKDTGGAFLCFEVEVPPGTGVGKHKHDSDCEAMFMLEGELVFENDAGARTCGVGDFTFFKSGDAHSFRNESGMMVRALVISSPGVEPEAFFEELDSSAKKPDFNVAEALIPMAKKRGIEVVV
jgi:quercetin dioxygenase-like cupin family protein